MDPLYNYKTKAKSTQINIDGGNTFLLLFIFPLSYESH